MSLHEKSCRCMVVPQRCNAMTFAAVAISAEFASPQYTTSPSLPLDGLVARAPTGILFTGLAWGRPP
jgi:hypothetical protein